MSNSSFLLKIESLRMRAGKLTGLKKMLSLKPSQDISARQWDVLNSQLASVSGKISNQLRLVSNRYLSAPHNVALKRILINRLGELEIELTNAYNFYDTFMDVLTQRLSDDVGPLLKGCDAIAYDALNRGMIGELTVHPLVYCDRGFGASTLREGVQISRGVNNPVQFIAIPYSRIEEKFNLISINHEAGHQALVKLNMVELLSQLVKHNLGKAGAPSIIQELYANWSKEISPDFWAFCLSGMAQPSSLRDVLMLPSAMMFHISQVQPHPPSYLRFLVAVDWCRQIWGSGDWDQWEREWVDLYPLTNLDSTTRQTIIGAKKFIPVIGKTLIETRFKKLNGKSITSLFPMSELNPVDIKKYATVENVQKPEFRKKSIGFQLAAFRIMRESRVAKQETINTLMNKWLINLN